MDRIHTIGRRKSSIARAFLSKGKGSIVINKIDLEKYFPIKSLQLKVCQPLAVLDILGKYDLKITVSGGGNTGQADAIKLAIARALCQLNPEHKTMLKSHGLLTRDARVVERKKPGQKKARKQFQWVKR